VAEEAENIYCGDKVRKTVIFVTIGRNVKRDKGFPVTVLSGNGHRIVTAVTDSGGKSENVQLLALSILIM